MTSDPIKSKQAVLFQIICPRLNRSIILFKQTWKEHIEPFHPVSEQHFELIQSLIKNCDENQPVWYKDHNPNKICIVRQVPHFLPYHKFILVAIRVFSEKSGCIMSVYPVDELPSKQKGYNVL